MLMQITQGIKVKPGRKAHMPSPVKGSAKAAQAKAQAKDEKKIKKVI